MKHSNFLVTLRKYIALPLALVAGLASLLGSGGGGGDGTSSTTTSTTLTGTAATGAPITGYVNVRDSAGSDKQASIGSDGAYSIDLADMTAPFILEADGVANGRSVKLYSAATSADLGSTVNVTPLTNVIVANAIGENPATSGLQNAVTKAASLTSAALSSHGQSLHTALSSVYTGLGVAGTIDPRTQSFSADHTGADAVLDLLDVSISGSTATIAYGGTSGTTITSDVTTGTYSGDIAATTLSADKTVLDEIKTYFQNYTSLLAITRTESQVQEFAITDTSDFKDYGDNLADYKTYMAGTETDSAVLELESIEELDTTSSPQTAKVHFLLKKVGRNPWPSTYYLIRNGTAGSNNTTAWRTRGDQDPYGFEISASFNKFDRRDIGSTTIAESKYRVGMWMELKITNAVAQHPTTDHIVVTGTGLPAGGVKLVNRGGAKFVMPATCEASTYCIPENKLNITKYVIYDSSEADTAIKAAAATSVTAIGDNEIYTVTLKNSGGTTLTTFTKALTRGPGTVTLADTHFPTLSTSTISNFVSLASGSTTLAWGAPTSGLSAPVPVTKQIQITYYDSGSTSYSPSSYLNYTATSYDLTLAATPDNTQYHSIRLQYQDQFWRDIELKSVVGPSGSY